MVVIQVFSFYYIFIKGDQNSFENDTVIKFNCHLFMPPSKKMIYIQHNI